MNSEAGRPNPHNMMQIEMNNSCLRHGCNCHCVQCILYIEPNAEEHSVGGLGKVLSLAACIIMAPAAQLRCSNVLC